MSVVLKDAVVFVVAEKAINKSDHRKIVKRLICLGKRQGNVIGMSRTTVLAFQMQKLRIVANFLHMIILSSIFKQSKISLKAIQWFRLFVHNNNWKLLETQNLLPTAPCLRNSELLCGWRGVQSASKGCYTVLCGMWDCATVGLSAAAGRGRGRPLGCLNPWGTFSFLGFPEFFLLPNIQNAPRPERLESSAECSADICVEPNAELIQCCDVPASERSIRFILEDDYITS